jgi:acyl carrier protein
MRRSDIEEVVLSALRNTNLARDPDNQLTVSPEAPIYGPDSALDSLGLVALIIDIEEGLGNRGLDVVLTDAHAMSQTRSPFRDVPALVNYLCDLCAQAQ